MMATVLGPTRLKHTRHIISEVVRDGTRVAAPSDPSIQNSTTRHARYKVPWAISAITWVCHYRWWVSYSPIEERRHVRSRSSVLSFADSPRSKNCCLVDLGGPKHFTREAGPHGAVNGLTARLLAA